MIKQNARDSHAPHLFASKFLQCWRPQKMGKKMKRGQTATPMTPVTGACTPAKWGKCRTDTRSAHITTPVGHLFLFFGSDLGKLAEPSYEMVLKRILGIRNQSSPVLRLSHSAVW